MSEPSGALWCQRYPTSRNVGDLTTDFAPKVRAFLAALKDAGIAVAISATYRPAERAYLMHWAWMIAHENTAPVSVPSMPGVGIDWLHYNSAGTPDLRGSVQAAEAMVLGYAIAYRPSLTSRHIERRAIDMALSWQGDAAVIDANGVKHIVGVPHDGLNPSIIEVGKTFGVIKLLSDPPHWSDDGH